MRKFLLALLLATVYISLTASPTIYGGTGLYRVYSADVGKQQRLQFSFHLHAFYQDILSTSRQYFMPSEYDTSVDYAAQHAYDTYGGGNIDFAFAFSPTKFLEFFVKESFMIDGIDEAEDVDTFNISHASYGFGDVLIGMKLDMLPIFTDQDIFHFGFLPFFTIPTGQKTDEFTPYDDIQFNKEYVRHAGGLFRPFTSGYWDYGMYALMSIYTPSDVPIEITGNAGYIVHTNTIVDPNQWHAYNEWLFGGGIAFHFPGFSPFVEMTYRRGVSLTPAVTGIPARERIGYVTGGFRFETTSGVVIDMVGDYLVFGEPDSMPDPVNNYYIPTGWGAKPQWAANLGISYMYDFYQPAPPPAPKPEPKIIVKKTIITGTVTDRETGNPISALLSFPGTNIPVVQVDSSGIYKVEVNVDSIPDGILRIRCKKPGYSWKEKTVTLTPNQAVVVDFELKKKQVKMGTIMGKITDRANNEPIMAKVSFPDNPEIKPVVTDDKGIYKVKLPPGTYVIEVSADGYISQSTPIVVKDEPLIMNFQLLKKGGKIVLHGIHFDSGKATIKPESYPILDQAVMMLKQNPTVKVEIQGHTDSVGSASYNLKLSQMRAEAVRNYLIEHGISPDRLIAKGYGESMPIASNATKEGRAQNRRIEFKIISY